MKPAQPYCPDWATALLNGFSQVLLQRNPLCGVLCLLAILYAAPDLLGGALLGAVGGLLTAQRRGYLRAHRQAGLYSYNGVLIGLLLSAQLPWSALLPLLILSASGLSAMLVEQWLLRRPLLPAYTSPFVLLGWLVLSLGQPAPPPPVAAHFSPSDVFNALGQIFVLNSPIAGALIALGVLIADRRAACWALAGSALGLGVAWLLGQPAISGLYGFNPALAALAFSSGRWQPLLAISLAVAVQQGFEHFQLPMLTAPFIFACWLVKAGTHLYKPATSQTLRSDSPTP
ncbi:MAG: urea transporter [Pseudomonas sp.]|uniref:urea transporter n=1 Tax=Pseudomonas abieticivorans TaxID=2931382 RepID=UPI0020BE1B71|nr:urea transporter [Pseudomonas sp. PIA16]MDE1164045.1 urea transporter [Pseudomonas sp.]